MKKIKLSREDIKKCQNFAEQVDTNFYSSRNQYNIEKRKIDSMIGKMGELVVYYNFIEKYPNISYPDFKIYAANEKSWDYDLKDPLFNLHVKSARVNSKFEESWLFENNDKHVFQDYHDNDYVCFVLADIPQSYGLIRKIIPISLLHKEKLFKKPQLDKLVTKSAIYYNDIKAFEDCLI